MEEGRGGLEGLCQQSPAISREQGSVRQPAPAPPAAPPTACAGLRALKSLHFGDRATRDLSGNDSQRPGTAGQTAILPLSLAPSGDMTN